MGITGVSRRKEVDPYMDIELLQELCDEDRDAISALILDCNQSDNTTYDPCIEGDFYYIIRNDDPAETGCSCPVLAMLSGYLLGETVDERQLLELSAFTHPAVRRIGLFSMCLNCLSDDFRDYRYRFMLKSCPGTDTPAKAAKQTLRHLRAVHQYDELYMDKSLPVPVSDPGDSLCSRYGEVHFTPFNSDTLYLYGLLVYDRYLRCGHGRRMLTEAESHTPGPFSRILLQVSSDNLPAVSLYRSMGYQVRDRILYYLLP